MSEDILRAEFFLSAEEREQVSAAIADAEDRSTGEIRVHLDDMIADNPLDHAAYVFAELDMHNTRDRNGVLFYVSVIDRKFAVIGDSGINSKVPDNFWDDVLHLVQEHFSKDERALGLVKGIEMAGGKLRELYPHSSSDTNELSNEVSIG